MAGLKELVEHRIKAREYTERVNHLKEGKSFYSLDGKDVRIEVFPDLFYKGGNIGYEFYGYDMRAITGEGDIGRVKVSYGEANLLKDGSPEEVRDLLLKKFPKMVMRDTKQTVTMGDLTKDKDNHIYGMADEKFKSKDGQTITDVNSAVEYMNPGKGVFYERQNGRPVKVEDLQLIEQYNRNKFPENIYSYISASVDGRKILVPLNKEETEMFREMDDWHRIELFDYKCGKIAIKDADNLNVKEGSVQALRTDNGAKLSIFRDGKVVEVGLSQKEVDKVMALDDSKRGKYLASLVPWEGLELEMPDKLELGKSSMRALSSNENNEVKDDNKEKGLDVKNVQAMVQGSFQSASVDNPENQERQRGAGLGM